MHSKLLAIVSASVLVVTGAAAELAAVSALAGWAPRPRRSAEANAPVAIMELTPDGKRPVREGRSRGRPLDFQPYCFSLMATAVPHPGKSKKIHTGRLIFAPPDAFPVRIALPAVAFLIMPERT